MQLQYRCAGEDNQTCVISLLLHPSLSPISRTAGQCNSASWNSQCKWKGRMWGTWHIKESNKYLCSHVLFLHIWGWVKEAWICLGSILLCLIFGLNENIVVPQIYRSEKEMEGLQEKIKGWEWYGTIWWNSGYQGLRTGIFGSGWLKETGSSGRDRFGKPQSKWQTELGDANGGWEVWSDTVHGSLWKMFCQTCLISFFGKKQVWQIGYMILVASY